jgi:hypothetical protein
VLCVGYFVSSVRGRNEDFAWRVEWVEKRWIANEDHSFCLGLGSDNTAGCDGEMEFRRISGSFGTSCPAPNSFGLVARRLSIVLVASPVDGVVMYPCPAVPRAAYPVARRGPGARPQVFGQRVGPRVVPRVGSREAEVGLRVATPGPGRAGHALTVLSVSCSSFQYARFLTPL